MVKKRKLRAGELGKYFVIFILPALIIYLLFSITPFLYTIYYSFTDYTDMNPINLHFVGLKNYIKVLQTPVMLAAIKNSVIYAILLTGFQTLLGLPLAFVLNQKLKSRNLLRAVFFFPAVFSSLIIGYLWNFIMSSSDFGLINNILHQLGLGTLNFFTSKNALYSVILTQIWQWTGWAMVIFLANLQSISPDLYEAAEIDGAGRFRRMISITIPCIKGTVMIMVIFAVAGILNNNFDQIYVLQNSFNLERSEVIDTYIYKIGIQQLQFGMAAAVNITKSFFSLALLLLANGIVSKLSDGYGLF